VELRRALLLFAVVLGLAAIASSLNRTDQEESGSKREQPQSTSESADRGASPGSETPRSSKPQGRGAGTARATVRFKAGGPAETRRIEAGAAATVLVDVAEPSQVQLDGLGLTQPADPLTPARFDVLVGRPIASEVLVTQAGGGTSKVVGSLIVQSEE
jgi:hypothetical protein